jgi:hypothetical protein
MEHVERGPATMSRGEGTATATRAGNRDRSERIRVEQHGATGLLWFAGWLFTIGFLQLSFWKGVLALLLWPYYVGTTVSALMTR